MNKFTKFLDIIYPPRCHICQNFIIENNRKIPHFCDPCLENFNEIKPPLCAVCGVPFESLIEENHLCEVCLRKRPSYDRLGAPYLYEEGIMDAIHQLKYNGKTYLAESLGRLLTILQTKSFQKKKSQTLKKLCKNFRKGKLLRRKTIKRK